MHAKRIIILLATIICSCTHTDHDKAFYDSIINDLRDNSYYAIISVKTQSYSGNAIVENDNLYHYYNTTEGLSVAEYKKTVYNLLSKKSTIILSDEDVKKWGFTKLNKSILEESERIEKTNISTIYAKGYIDEVEISEEQKAAMIYQLYQMNILSYIDDESGYLVLKKTE